MPWQKTTLLKALRFESEGFSGQGVGRRTARGGTSMVKGSVFVNYDIPEIAILMRPPEEMCMEICTAIAARIKAGIRSGRDIHGRTIALKPETVALRVYNMQPPRQSRSGRGMLRKRMLKAGATFEGRLRGSIVRGKRVQGTRWERLFPGGPSKGGSTPFYSSGFLHDSIKVEAPFKTFGQGNRAAVSVVYDRKRRAAVVSLARRGIELVGIPQGELGGALERELESILAPIGGVGGMRAGWGRLTLGAILRGVSSGLGV